MEVIGKLQSKEIVDVIGPTVEVFSGLLEKNRKEIESVKKETFQYGSSDRHKLDVYYPSTSNDKAPILFFTYGGGLQVGDRNEVVYNNHLYANLGAFFAKRGFLTIVADYRLSIIGDPNRAKYPECSQDAFDALSWVISSTEINKVADTQKIYLQGHSAGGMIQASLLLHPTMLPDDVRSRIKGAIWNGGVFHFETSPPAMPFQNYFGTEGGEKQKSAFGLLKSASDAVVASLPPLLIINAQNEVEVIVETSVDFIKLLKERNGPEVTEYENPGHNHISSVAALLSGEGEDWGEEVVRWLEAH